jgi:hypothetical protein
MGRTGGLSTAVAFGVEIGGCLGRMDAVTLARVRQHALSLPEAAEEPHFAFSSFRIRGRIFVTVPPEGDHIHVFVDEPEREEALARHPDFLEPLRWGARVVGLRVTLAEAVPSVVTALVTQAWVRKAPKRLRGRVTGAGPP